MATTSALDTLDRARRTANASEYRVVETAEGFSVDEPYAGLARWQTIAWFLNREDMEAFLTAMLPPPADHLPARPTA